MNDNTNASRSTIPVKTDKQLRMGYYQGIKTKGDFSETFIAPPPHWLTQNIFSIDPNFGK